MIRTYANSTDFPMSEVFAGISFFANLVFFIWFGGTLNSVNRHLGSIADQSERQTKLLASIANSTPDPRPGDRATASVSNTKDYLEQEFADDPALNRA